MVHNGFKRINPPKDNSQTDIMNVEDIDCQYTVDLITRIYMLLQRQNLWRSSTMGNKHCGYPIQLEGKSLT